MYELCTDVLFYPDEHLHFKNSFVQIGKFFEMQIKVEKKSLFW